MTPFSLTVVLVRLIAIYMIAGYAIVGFIRELLVMVSRLRETNFDISAATNTFGGSLLANLGYYAAYAFIGVVLYLNAVAIATRLSRGLDTPPSSPTPPATAA